MMAGVLCPKALVPSWSGEFFREAERSFGRSLQ